MPREIPDCPAVPCVKPSGETRDYRIEVVTPLFGGGVEAGEPDPMFPIRGTSIRGHLQFWWRATRGAAFQTSKELFARQAEVWGQTDRVSPVIVSIRDAQIGTIRRCAEYRWNSNKEAKHGRGDFVLQWLQPFEGTSLTYALFPFQGEKPKQREPGSAPKKMPAQYIDSASFSLRLQFPKSLEHDISTAVWAWVNFGGLGSRTRRGCGTLLCRDLAPNRLADLGGWFRVNAGAVPDAEREWPTLPEQLLVHPRTMRPLESWNRVLDLLRHFRQGEGFARNPGARRGRPGRSRYPEPETIREVPGSGANRQISGHQRLAHIPADAFPRAELGLPIVFHFKGRGEPPGRPDLSDLTLYPGDGPDGLRRDRMASPLILKPLVFATGESVPLILRLRTPRLEAVDLRQGDRSLRLPPTTVIQHHRLATYQDSPLANAESGSALDAFCALALDPSNGFQDITR